MSRRRNTSNSRTKRTQWRASHILVKDMTVVEKVNTDLAKGIPFAAVAKRYSTCPSKKKGGDLGWFSAGKMIPAFERVVKSMKVDTVSKPIVTQFGIHIICKSGER
jgi:peptidyl-prolyl cis-trans isomerase C